MWNEDLPEGTSVWKFLSFVTRPYYLVAAVSIAFVSLGAAANVAVAYVFKTITNSAYTLANGGSVTLLWQGTAAYIGLSLVSNLLWRGSGFVGMHWSTGVRATSRYALSAYITRHSYNYFGSRFAGSIASKVSQASNSIKNIVDSILWDFIPFLVAIIGSFILAFHTSPPIALIFLVWVCVITPLNVFSVRKGVPLSVATQQAETTLGGATVDMLTNMTAVHEYARQPFELERLKTFILARRSSGLANWRFREFLRLGNGILQTLFIGGMIATATVLTGKGILSVGDIILVLTIILIVEDRITFIGNELNNFGDAWGQVVESLSDIVRPYEISDAPNATPLPDARGELSLDTVSFDYGGEVAVLDAISLRIPAGQKVGLVGRSGAGKSTLMRLLLRHYTLIKGTIAIDGNDIAKVTLESLRKAMAVVPQEPLLFHRSIRDNIAYGNSQATDAEIEQVAKLAEAHEFITRVPGGYDALVGERGVKLSGGQRQRIAIARAMLKDAPILLLDEATSSLDSESEVAVQRALHTLMAHRTVIAIAHRLSTLRAMDRIIVMDSGHVVEDGTHAELLEKGGIYASLWNHQADGFLKDEEGGGILSP